MIRKRICDYCKKPMGNSWHTETDVGELEMYVHSKCSDKWFNREVRKMNILEKKERNDSSPKRSKANKVVRE